MKLAPPEMVSLRKGEYERVNRSGFTCLRVAVAGSDVFGGDYHMHRTQSRDGTLTLIFVDVVLGGHHYIRSHSPVVMSK